MYHVPTTPRPSFARVIIHSIWYGAVHGAIYGLGCGTFYGALWLIFGAIYGAPIGLAFGTAVGVADGLIIGAVLYRSTLRHASDLDQRVIFARETSLRCFIAGFSFLFCAVGGHIYYYGDRLVERIQRYGTIQAFLKGDSLGMIIIPSVIAAICGYVASGQMLRWYLNRWVLAEPAGATLRHRLGIAK
jgi:hypothetical protein